MRLESSGSIHTLRTSPNMLLNSRRAGQLRSNHVLPPSVEFGSVSLVTKTFCGSFGSTRTMLNEYGALPPTFTSAAWVFRQVRPASSVR